MCFSTKTQKANHSIRSFTRNVGVQFQFCFTLKIAMHFVFSSLFSLSRDLFKSRIRMCFSTKTQKVNHSGRNFTKDVGVLFQFCFKLKIEMCFVFIFVLSFKRPIHVSIKLLTLRHSFGTSAVNVYVYFTFKTFTQLVPF